MSWHYQILRHKSPTGEEWYALHEAYTDPTGYTADPIDFRGDSPEEVVSALRMALKDAERHPVVNADDL